MLTAGALALALLPAPSLGQSSNPAAGKSDHPAAVAPNTASQIPEQFAPSKTGGTVEVEGKSIAYTATAGTLTVGATDEQDAMIAVTSSSY